MSDFNNIPIWVNNEIQLSDGKFEHKNNFIFTNNHHYLLQIRLVQQIQLNG